MKLTPDASTVKQSLSAHAAIGLLAGALLYLICLTGTLVVFYEEWQRFEQNDAPEMRAIAPDAVQRAVGAVIASERGKPTTTHLYVHMPVEALPRTTITTDTQAVHIGGDGAIAAREENAWSEFLLGLHYYLHMPALVGISIVGALGAMMIALALSGVIAHPRIFRDAFRLRARHSGGIALSDWHNRLSVWTLPFTVTIALTGAIIGLATLAAFGIASVYYDGKVEAVYSPIFGAEAEPDPAPAPMPDVAAALNYMKSHYPDVEVTYAIVHDPLTKGQHVQIVGDHPRRLIFGEYYAFDAAGNFHGTAGLSDGKMGQQAAASIYKLHFGNFGGLTVKIVYFILGFALTAVCATGTYIWLRKRRQRGHDEPGLRAAWHAVVWGSPVVLAVTLAVRLIAGNDAPFVALFWIGWPVVILAWVLAVRRRRAVPRQA